MRPSAASHRSSCIYPDCAGSHTGLFLHIDFRVALANAHHATCSTANLSDHKSKEDPDEQQRQHIYQQEIYDAAAGILHLTAVLNPLLFQ